MSNPPVKEQSQHPLKHELHDLISILTGLGKNNNGGISDATGIVTLAGTNRGATMRVEGPESAVEVDGVHQKSDGQGMEAFANSNCQSINNSIVIGGSCGAEDPGVHITIEDYVEEGLDEDGAADLHETKKKEKENKEKGKKGKQEEKTHKDEDDEVL